jgi:SPP1 gp7 family putative phage head morphogenesis protein
MDNFLKEYNDVIASFFTKYSKNGDIADELYNLLYAKEFNKYLRRGQPPRVVAIKQVAHAIRLMEQADESTELLYKRADIDSQTEPRLYIWGAIGDDKVRGLHAAKDGEIFDWNSADLRPGEDYNCRCYAEFIDKDHKGNIWYGKETVYLKNGEYHSHFIQALSPESLQKTDNWYHDQYKKCKASGQPMIPYHQGLPADTLHNNIQKAENKNNCWGSISFFVNYPSDIWFGGRVQSGGEWDYKKEDYAKEDFGNFNYGATGRALGFNEETLLRMAGTVQRDRKAEWGHFDDNNIFISDPNTSYGDDPRDQEMIKQGIDYYDNDYKPNFGKQCP